MKLLPIACVSSLFLCNPALAEQNWITFWPFRSDTITRKQVEDAGGLWPLTVDSIRFRCTTAAGKKVAIYEFPSGGNETKYFRLIGTETAIKSTSLTANSSIWRPNPRITGAKTDISSLRAAGDARCK